jgi:hypothetical protein
VWRNSRGRPLNGTAAFIFDIGLSDLANLTRCKQAALECGAASTHGEGVQFVSGPAFEIIEEFFAVSLVQRFKSLRGTYGRLGIQ